MEADSNLTFGDTNFIVKRLRTVFPLSYDRNVAMFYVLSSVYNLWFMGGVWVFIWGRFMSKTQIGISDAFTFFIGFLFELPSGVIADLMGRRKAILLGNILLVVGNLLIGISSSFGGITVWYLVWTIGYAFQSGATEALAYDSVKKMGKESEWSSVIATSTVIGKTTSLIATGLGGFLFAAWFRLPYIALGAIGIVGIVAAYLLREIPVLHRPNMWSINTYLKQIKDGVSTLGKPTVLPISVVSLTIAGVAYLYNWGLLRPLTGERFGYTPVNFPILLSIISLCVILATYFLVKRKVQVEKVLLLSAISFSVIFFVLGLPHKWIMGGLLMVSLSISSMYVDQLFSRFINLHTQPEHRATTLSAVALFTRAPYVILALLIGVLAEKNLLPQFTMVLGSIAIIVSAFSWLKYRTQLRKLSIVK